MERAWICVVSAFGIVLTGCSGDVVHASSQATLAASSAAAGGGAGGAGGAGAGGAGGSAASGALTGHYMQQTIGNCIHFEEWLSFDAPPGFTHTDVDRDYCAAHSVVATPGSYKLSGEKLEMAWSSPAKGSALRRFTHARIDPFPGGPIVPWPQGYMPGTAAINRMAYVQKSSTLTWHRDDGSTSNGPGGSLWDQQIAVDVVFDAPLGDPAGKTACSMTVTLSVAVTSDAAKPPDKGSETFKLPCSYDHDKTLPWVRITANGFEQSMTDGSWMDYLTKLGIWNKYAAWVSNAFYDAFRPVFFYVPGDDSRLFHDVGMAWYQEMKSPPPSSVQ